MDRNRFSSIAHRNHAFSNPISEAKIMKMVKMVSLKKNNRVVDIGSGKGELLIRLVENFQVEACGIELYEGAVETARQEAKKRIPDGRIEFIVEDAKTALGNFENEEIDLGVCIGSTHALGGLEPTLQALKKIVRNNGYILIGEGYWKKTPSSEYLEALGGAEESDLKSHAENVQTAAEHGLIPLWSYVASEDDWDEYEWLYASSIENYCFENPVDPDKEAMLQRIRAWRKTYLQWGRDTLGFGMYLFRNQR